MPEPLTLLCVMAATNRLYAVEFLREAKRLGCRVLVLTQADQLERPWPREIIDLLFAVEDIFNPTLVRNTVSFVARSEAIDRIVGLGEYDIEIAATLREHFRLSGIPYSDIMYFRDKLAMRVGARERDIRVPDFTPVFNDRQVADFMERVPGPWLLKPRTEASSVGIRKIHHPGELWQAFEQLGDARSGYLLERFTPGEVYHVESIVDGGRILFATAHRYGTPILELHTHGGVYTTLPVARGSKDDLALKALNERIITELGLPFGVTHIEYILHEGEFYFLEATARVGAGLIEDIVMAECGIDLWGQWARLEVAQTHPSYELPALSERYAGAAVCMTTVEHPNLSRFAAPDVLTLSPKPYHAGLIVRGDDAETVSRRVRQLADRLATEFLAHA